MASWGTQRDDTLYFLTLLNCPQIKIFLTVLKSAWKGLLEIVQNLYWGISGSREIAQNEVTKVLWDTLYDPKLISN